MVGIYKITSPTGKIYIGQSWNLQQRANAYKQLKCTKQPKLHSSLLKHGWADHTFEIIHTLPTDIDQTILNTYETLYWQQYLDCNFQMLNIKEPGSNGKHSQESKQKITNSKLGKKRSAETVKKVANSLKGIKRSSEVIRRRIETRKRIGTNKKQSERMTGHKQPKETIEKRKQTRKDAGLGKKKILHVETGIVYPSRKEAAAVLNLDPSTIRRRLLKGLFKYV